MKFLIRRLGRLAVPAFLLGVMVGCVPVTGSASLTVLGRTNGTTVRFEPMGQPVERSDCLYWVLLGMGGNGLRTHESVVERILEDTGADVIVDAQFYNESWGVPYIFMMNCATVEGQPAKVVAR